MHALLFDWQKISALPLKNLPTPRPPQKSNGLPLNPSVRSLWWWVLDPKNRTVTTFELWAQHVRGFQPFLNSANLFTRIKIFTTLQRFVQVNVFSSLEADCLTLSAYLGQVVEGVTLHKNKFMQIWDKRKLTARACYCALTNENTTTCIVLYIDQWNTATCFYCAFCCTGKNWILTWFITRSPTGPSKDLYLWPVKCDLQKRCAF